LIGEDLGVGVHIEADSEVDEDVYNHRASHDFRHLHSVARRGLVEPEKQVLVDPIGGDVLKRADKVKHRHPRRVEHHDVVACQNLRIPDLNEELRAGI